MTNFYSTLTADLPDGWSGKESITLLAPDAQANVIASNESLDPSIDSHQYADIQAGLLRSEFPGYREFSFGKRTVFGARSGFEQHFLRPHPDRRALTQIQLYYASGSRGY